MSGAGQIFIGGCDRSGTTMLASMLGGHSRVLCLPESHFFQQFAASGLAGDALVSAIEKHPRFELWGVDLSAEDRAELAAQPGFSAFADLLARFYARSHGVAGHEVWVDHAPRNCGRFLTLARAFPQARFVHMVRDGRAVANSWMGQDWGPNNITAVADAWALRLAQGLSAEAALGDRIVRISYEEVVADPEVAIRKVAGLAGIAFEAAMLDARGFRLPEHSKDTHSLLTADSSRGVSSGRLESWRRDLHPRQIELFESRAGDLLEALGYDPVNVDPQPQTRKEKLRDLGRELYLGARNIPRRNRRHGFGTFR
ncbi:sulfotransferase family protein [Qipengyuania zhejiangensis]|uniref:sulfotransferase family protein n=1 Tax=Qipengyuania zhejiangensis TaxID=3077782 RepID=UPI002D79892B|nr:sulfotransferase [Qipengyuania sp. Z2]